MDEIRRCDACGRPPAHDQWEVGASFSAAAASAPLQRPASHEMSQDAPFRRRRRRITLPVIVLSWVVFMVLLVMVARKLWKDPADAGQSGGAGTAGAHASHLNNQFLKDHLPAVYDVFADHVAAVRDEHRAQTIHDPVRVTPRLMRFFELNPLIRIDLEKMTLQSETVTRLPEGDVIEALWKCGDRTYESAFIRQGTEWKLDWEHFARYSDFPLSLYLAGGGPDEAEFRLFARERLAEERKKEPEMSVVLYSTVAGMLGDAGVQTPAFLVPRGSEMGRRLAAGFAQGRSGVRPFDSRLAVEQPADLIRVRVKLRRKLVDGVREFEIADVMACHWYGITDAPGVSDEPVGASGFSDK